MTNQSGNNEEKWMREAFINVQEKLKLDLRMAKQSIDHPGEKGDVHEDHWIEVFRAYLPKRYEVGKGIIIDSKGGKSDQIDIVIFDKQYTPTLLDQQNFRYIPAEAVYAIFESKPCINKEYLEYAGSKAASVRNLYRTSKQITHAGGEYKPKDPFAIIAGIVAAHADWSDGLGESFITNLPDKSDEFLDCGCALTHGSFDQFDGELKIVSGDVALIYFLFRLLDKLQSLGTVQAIDWTLYANILKI